MAQNYGPNYGTAPYGAAAANLYGAPGYGMNPNMTPAKMTTTLTEEEIEKLRQKGETFSLQLTKEEVMRGICVHRNANGSSALIDNPDGTCTCTICHHTFAAGEYTDDEVQRAVDMVLNILQTCKLLYLDMPDAAAKEFYQIIPLIAKIPKLFNIAADNFRRHEKVPGFMPGQAMSPFAIFGAMSTPGAYPYYNQAPAGAPWGGVPGYNGYQNPAPQPQQQYYGAPQQAQAPWGAPGYNPYPQQQWTAPAPSVTGWEQQQAQQNPAAPSPFGYPGASDPNANNGYRPTTGGYQYNPGQPQQNGQPAPQQAQAQPNQQPQQQAPANDKVTVNTTLKA